MSHKKRVKGKQVPPQKHLQDLAANDYVEPNDELFSDSDILAPQGVGIRNSNSESREEKVQFTLAESEQRERMSYSRA